MELSRLPVMLLLVLLVPASHAQVRSKAVVSIKPDTHVFIGERVTLICDIQGGGGTQRSYSWYKNNDFINQYGDTLSFWVDANAGRDDYTCRGDYTQLESAAVTLTVSAKPKPTLIMKPQSLVYTGDTVTLTCNVDQGTGWEFQWHRNNQWNVDTEQKYTNTLKLTVNNAGETVCQCVARRRNPWTNTHYDTQYSNEVTITARERPQAVLSVSPQRWLTEGDSATLNCEVTDSSTDWTFSWYRHGTYRDGTGHISYKFILLSDSSRGSGGSYTLSPAALKHTGVYVCRGERGEPALHTQYSNLQPLWITGESPPVSLIINPSRTQHFTGDSLSLSCEDQRDSTGWTVRRYTHIHGVSDCSRWGSVTGSTCKISSLYTFDTGVYWCESESGENSNPVNITVQDRDVILVSPVHPLTEGRPLTLRCLYRNTKSSNLRADFYKDGSVLQTQTTGEMIIHKVSKSDEGFYHCKYTERGESPKSWVSVRGSSGIKATFSVLMLISSAVTASPYLLVTIILLVKCYRARAHTEEKRIETAVTVE